jgi:hypothetical protein
MIEHLIYLSSPFDSIYLLCSLGLNLKCRGLNGAPISYKIVQNGLQMSKICSSKVLVVKNGSNNW